MSKKTKRSILINNLQILEISRIHQVDQFINRDVFLFNSILDSHISRVLKKLSQEKIKLFWLDNLWLIALKRIENENDLAVKELKMESFIHIYKTHITELYNKSKGSVETEIYTETLNKKQEIINSLIKTGLKSEAKLNVLKLDIRINSIQFNKLIENEKNRNTRNV